MFGDIPQQKYDFGALLRQSSLTDSQIELENNQFVQQLNGNGGLLRAPSQTLFIPKSSLILSGIIKYDSPLWHDNFREHRSPSQHSNSKFRSYAWHSYIIAKHDGNDIIHRELPLIRRTEIAANPGVKFCFEWRAHVKNTLRSPLCCRL